jgi:hypothetical protein
LEELFYKVFAQTTFYQATSSLYLELAAFGTAVMLVEEGQDEPVRFTTLTVGEYWLATNADHKVDTVYRRIRMTARNIVQRFGTANVSREIKNAIDPQGSLLDEYYNVIHVVQPKSGKKGVWESVYIEEYGEKKILQEKEYKSFPYLCPRWETIGSNVYGFSPGFDVLPDVMQFQDMCRTESTATHKSVNPPTTKPSTMRRLNVTPGAENPVRPGQKESVGALYEIRPELNAMHARILDKKQEIREALFYDIFLMIAQEERHNVTATEINAKRQEKMLQLGPVVERVISEFLNPLIARVYDILLEKMMVDLDSMPEDIAASSIQIEYMSPLAQAQKSTETASIREVVEFVAQVAQVKPEVLDLVNEDEMVRSYSHLSSAPVGIIRDNDAVNAIRQQRAEKEARMQQLAMQQQMLASGADAAAKVGGIPTGDGSMAKSMQESMQ